MLMEFDHFNRLQNAKADVWGDKVTLVFADMRKWTPPAKVRDRNSWFYRVNNMML